MKDFCYWETIFTSPKTCIRRKILLVKNDVDELIGKFNLTKMGIDEVNSYEELSKYSPTFCYEYKEDE